MSRQGRRFLTPLVFGAIVWTSVLLTGGVATAAELNFGEVPIHTSSKIDISLTNNECFPMTVSMSLKSESGFFSIDSDWVLYLSPDETIYVPVTFSPTEVGGFSAILEFNWVSEVPAPLPLPGSTISLTSTAPPGGKEEVQLQGEGVSAEEKKGVQGLLDFFDDAVEKGTLKGYGPGKSADGRLNALRDMLVEAATMEDAGDTEGARGQLLAVIKKLQEKEKGKSMPFAEGVAVPELISKIQEAVENLGQSG